MKVKEIMQLALDMVNFDTVPGDSAIYYDGGNREIARILMGIDISTAELKMAKDMGFDMVIAHHPPSLAALQAHEVYARHAHFMMKNGVPEEAAWEAVKPRMNAIAAGYQAANHDHYPSIARLLDMPFANIHAPLDELGRRKMQAVVDSVLNENSQALVADIVAALNNMPEFKQAYTSIEVAVGEPANKAGRVVVAHGALTNGGYPVANAYFEHGVSTVIYIHCGHQDLVRLRKEAKGNLIITGHIASDVVGIRPFMEELRQQGVEVVGISGLSTW